MIIFSLMSRFNTRKGSASTKGTKQRLDKLGVLYWQKHDGPGFIICGYCRNREEYEGIKRTLSIYAGCSFPIGVESADGSLTYREIKGYGGVIIQPKEKVSDDILAKIQGLK